MTETPENSGPVKFGTTNPILVVANLDASVDYYVNVLGFKVDWRYGDTIASVSRDRCALFLSVDDQGHPGTWVWIGVSDAAALFEELLVKGALIRQAPTNHGWALEMQVQDLDGNVLRFGSDHDENRPAGIWHDMRGDHWQWGERTGWTKIPATDAAQLYLDQAALFHKEQNFQFARYAWFNAVELLRQHGTKLELAQVLRELGEIERTRQYEVAELHYLEAIALYRELHERWPFAHALGHLAMLYDGQGQVEQAEKLYVEALVLCRRIEDLDPLDLANTGNRLARFYDRGGRYPEAEPLLTEANELYEIAGIKAGVAGTAARLALICARGGRTEESQAWLVKATAAATIGGDPEVADFVREIKAELEN